MVGRTIRRVSSRHFERVLIYVVAMGVMKMAIVKIAIVKIVCVVTVLDSRMAAVRSMSVFMVGGFITSYVRAHLSPNSHFEVISI